MRPCSVYLALHNFSLYNSFIGCRNAIAEGKPSKATLQSRSLEPKCSGRPACQGCLLHPPPLVDLARDLRSRAFFLKSPCTHGFPSCFSLKLHFSQGKHGIVMTNN